MPNSWADRKTRIAISLRLATSSLVMRGMGRGQRGRGECVRGSQSLHGYGQLLTGAVAAAGGASTTGRSTTRAVKYCRLRRSGRRGAKGRDSHLRRSLPPVCDFAGQRRTAHQSVRRRGLPCFRNGRAPNWLAVRPSAPAALAARPAWDLRRAWAASAKAW
jgi:hypothetical protein